MLPLLILNHNKYANCSIGNFKIYYNMGLHHSFLDSERAFEFIMINCWKNNRGRKCSTGHSRKTYCFCSNATSAESCCLYVSLHFLLWPYFSFLITFSNHYILSWTILCDFNYEVFILEKHTLEIIDKRKSVFYTSCSGAYSWRQKCIEEGSAA